MKEYIQFSASPGVVFSDEKCSFTMPISSSNELKCSLNNNKTGVNMRAHSVGCRPVHLARRLPPTEEARWVMEKPQGWQTTWAKQDDLGKDVRCPMVGNTSGAVLTRNLQLKNFNSWFLVKNISHKKVGTFCHLRENEWTSRALHQVRQKNKCCLVFLIGRI